MRIYVVQLGDSVELALRNGAQASEVAVALNDPAFDHRVLGAMHVSSSVEFVEDEDWRPRPEKVFCARMKIDETLLSEWSFITWSYPGKVWEPRVYEKEVIAYSKTGRAEALAAAIAAAREERAKNR